MTTFSKFLLNEQESYSTNPDERIIIRLLEEAYVKIERAESKAVKYLGEENRLSDELIPIMNKIEDEIMFIEKANTVKNND